MTSKVQKWGNSQGVRFPRKLLEQANIEVGDPVDISVSRGQIIVTPSRQIRGKYRLEDLLDKMPDDYEADEVDWGEPLGAELW